MAIKAEALNRVSNDFFGFNNQLGKTEFMGKFTSDH
jgi:hypothetical protein